MLFWTNKFYSGAEKTLSEEASSTLGACGTVRSKKDTEQLMSVNISMYT